MRRFDGGHLRRARVARNMTREQLASRTGKSFFSISAYESGRVTPSTPALAAIADALDCPLDDLFGGTE